MVVLIAYVGDAACGDDVVRLCIMVMCDVDDDSVCRW